MPTSAKKRDLPANPTCDTCGRRLVIDPAAKGRIARFCSPGCRTAYHRGKRPQPENLPSLQELLTTIEELAEGTHSFDRELTAIKNILIEYYRQKKT